MFANGNGLLPKRSAVAVALCLAASAAPGRVAAQEATDGSCSIEQVERYELVLDVAIELLDRAVSDMREAPVSLRPEAPRTTLWFGAYDPARYEEALSRLARMHAHATEAPPVPDCSICISPFYIAHAQVDPTSIALCERLFSAPLRGTDSASEGLVRELARYERNGGGKEFAGAIVAALDLAATDPERAVQNPRNLSLFSVNQPEQDMPTPEDLRPGEEPTPGPEPGEEPTPGPEPEPEPTPGPGPEPEPEPEPDPLNPFEPIEEPEAPEDEPVGGGSGDGGGGGGALFAALALLGGTRLLRRRGRRD